MGIYYFAVDYSRKEKMEPPKGYGNSFLSVINRNHILPQLMALANFNYCDFRLVGDVNTYEEHEYADVTQKWIDEYTRYFPEIKLINDIDKENDSRLE